MSKKQGNPVKFEAMIKAFMEQCDIPGKADIERLVERIDRLEKIVMQSAASQGKSVNIPMRTLTIKGSVRGSMTASGQVLEVVRGFKQGVDFARLQNRTGFEDKKLRNIIFRLNKIGKITRKSRGVYVTS